MTTKDPIKKVVEVEEHLLHKLVHDRNTALERYPLLFTVLTALGLVATFYGFEHLLDQVPFLAHNGWAMSAFGLGILLLTGTLYKKLG